MKGLPKIHKPGIPLGSITSGIGSALHRLVKVLAKPLSSALGSINGAVNAIKEAVHRISEENLPVCKRDYMALIEKCIRFGSFRFGSQEYHQLEGLPMGSPLSAVAASLYLEVLEKNHYKKILPKDAVWFRYVDDCLFISLVETDEGDILSKLNKDVKNIQFTMEAESHGRPPFLDLEIIRNGKEAIF
ncbi:uncharacterized protein LOC143035601 [Oratosquilla oratoria]|uniref:uncharacterized protein LOC143035601 n=1 Tax=Oratosquilla oratoria TaxID=337810 RepID=UPI003F7682A2